ncbi:MAG: CoA-transferase [Alphaproteobacteria bacterium]|jgi:glutaconate CoA-transferase subunit A|nr:CoA-transferase [Alphaproteobacteria bacterium]MDP6516164.1 CoA-transferase [Alphaproteobacteria bacterium]
MAAEGVLATLEELVGAIPDASSVIAPTDSNGVPMAATRSLIRRGARDLHLIGGATAGLMADLLIGAGCLAEIETAAVSLGEFGLAPRFRAAVEAGELRVRDSTCPAIHGALQAAEKGNPFMPLRGLIGSDLMHHRPDWKVIDNPFAAPGTDKIVLLPALVPDIALFHAAYGDRDGNVWIGLRREVMTMAHAARHTLVTVERIHDGSLLDDPAMAAGTLPALYVDRIAVCPQGCWPLGFADLYPADADHMRAYAAAARTGEGFRAYLKSHVLIAAAAE